MVNQNLVKFIKEARKRGFEDFQIRDPLIKNGWPEAEVERAFSSLRKNFPLASKNRIEIYLPDEIMKSVQKRADKNLLTLTEQIEDILRRSTLNKKNKTPKEEKLDDKFITYFSRKK